MTLKHMSTLNCKTFFTPKELLNKVNYINYKGEDESGEMKYFRRTQDLVRNILPITTSFIFIAFDGTLYVYKRQKKWGINFVSATFMHFVYKNKEFVLYDENFLCFDNVFDALQLVYNWLNNIEKPVGI